MEGENASLEEVVKYLEAEHGFLFSYKNEDIQDVKVVLPSKAHELEDFLTIVLQNKKIEFEVIQDDYIILKKDTTTLFSEGEKKEKILLCGIVIDGISKVPLEYANVYLKDSQQGTSSKVDGSFEFKTLLKPNDTILVSYIGFEVKKMLASELAKQPCQKISLKNFEFEEDLVVVKDYLTDGIDLRENTNATVLQPNRIGALPGQAEPDVLSTIQFLPGVVSPDGSASNINIRGGTSDQNLILWEDIPIYHAAHYFGMISAINPYIINKASVYRGGFDAEYGGRISGVIDMKSDDAPSTNHNIGMGVNFLNAYANGKIKLLDNKAFLVFSARHSLSDIWRSPTFENITRRIQQGVLFDFVGGKIPNAIRFNDDFKFSDYNVKLSFKASKKDEISIASFYANNDFRSMIDNEILREEQNDNLFLENIGGSFSWKHQWNSSVSTKVLAIGTDYRYDYTYQYGKVGEMNPLKAGKKMSQIKEQQIHLINSYLTPTNHTIKLGYQFNQYNVAYELRKESKDGPQNNIDSKIKTNLQIIYSSFNTAPEKRFGVDAGARVSYFQNAQKFFFEPRLRSWFNINQQWKIYANTGKYHQFLSQVVQLKGDNSSIDTPVWVVSGDEIGRDNSLPILTSIQTQVGIIYQNQGWVLDFQTYNKNVKGLTSVATGFDEGISNSFLVGDAKIRGLDILIKKRWRSFRNWISYSLGKSDHNFREFFDPEFSAPNDLRHVLHLVSQWKNGPWECSLGWQLTSGSPYSLKENFRVEDNNNGMGPNESIQPVVYNFNSERLPFRHQLDASVVYNFSPKEKKWKGVVGLSLMNIYHQQNIYERSLFLDNNTANSQGIRYIDKSDLRFTPNLVLKVEW